MLDAGAGPITADTVAARMHQLGFRTLAREPLIQSAFASGLRKLQSDARLVSARKADADNGHRDVNATDYVAFGRLLTCRCRS